MHAVHADSEGWCGEGAFLGETKIGLVPGLQVQRAWGPRPSTLLVTDHRSIFFLEGGKGAALVTALVGAAAAGFGGGPSAQDQADYESLDPERLTRERENVTIPHGAVQHLRLRRLGAGASLKIRYATSDGKATKLKAQLMVPGKFWQKMKAEGAKRGEAFRAYMEQVKETYLKALPPSLAHRTEWRI